MKRVAWAWLGFIANLCVGQAPSLSFQGPIAGLDKVTGQFVCPLDKGFLLVGLDDVSRIAADNSVIWRYAIAKKRGRYGIDCFSNFRDSSFLLGIWNRSGSKTKASLLKIDLNGNRIWERALSINEARIQAITPAARGNSIWAIVKEEIKGNAFRIERHTAILFDSSGQIKSKFDLQMAAKQMDFSDDVSVFSPSDSVLYVFGGTFGNTLEAYKFRLPAIKGDNPQLIASSTLEGDAFYKTLKGFVNFIVIRNPGGGFYAAYTSHIQGTLSRDTEDYRLLLLNDDLSLVWKKDFGGDQSDGVSGLTLDASGNVLMVGYSYSGISGAKTEPAFERNHCDAWLIKANAGGEKLWDKTITGPGCILQAKVFARPGMVGVVFREETGMMIAVMKEK